MYIVYILNLPTKLNEYRFIWLINYLRIQYYNTVIVELKCYLINSGNTPRHSYCVFKKKRNSVLTIIFTQHYSGLVRFLHFINYFL